MAPTFETLAALIPGLPRFVPKLTHSETPVKTADYNEFRGMAMRIGSYLRSMLPVIVSGALLLLAVIPARAGIIFNNLGPGNSYASIGWSVTGSSIRGSSGHSSVESAMSFTPSDMFVLTQIDVAIGFASGTNSVAFSLNSDSGGLPGAVLLNWTRSSLPVFGTCCIVQTLIPPFPLPLTPGTRYWIVGSVLAADTSDGWNQNNTGSTGLLAFNIDGEGFSSDNNFVLGAFDVLGNAVPETATTALSGGGFFLLAVLGWQVKNRRRSNDPS
jgi:hypothetical protein